MGGSKVANDLDRQPAERKTKKISSVPGGTWGRYWSAGVEGQHRIKKKSFSEK